MNGQINVELLLRVKEQALREPKRIRMAYWFTDGEGEDQDPHHPIEFMQDCDTAGCIGGWGLVLAGVEHVCGWEHARQEMLRVFGLDEPQAMRLFHLGHWPEDLRDRHYEAELFSIQRAQIIAERIDRFIATEGRE